MPPTASDNQLRFAREISIVLASASPRRRALLEGLGLDFAVQPADIDESARVGEGHQAYVERLAREKALEASQRAIRQGDEAEPAAPEAKGRDDGAHGDGTYGDGTLWIAADTVVVADGELLGKPTDPVQNLDYLTRLAGRTHQVSTGHCLIRGARVETAVRTTDVTFRDLTLPERTRYVATGEGRDKAGGYAIQGVGAALVDRIDGCYFNVVGLSLPAIVTLARRLGVALV